MIIRGGGATGGAGRAGAGLCICVTLLGAEVCTGGAPPACAAGGVARGTAIAGDAAFVEATGVAAAGGVTGTFGGITTTDGGRYVAATEAGVTIRGADPGVGGVSVEDLGGIALGAAGAEATGAAVFVSAAGAATTGLTAGRGAGASAAPFCWIARSTSPGREIFDKSILVLMPSSAAALREALAELGAASERPRRCFRTRSAS